jgi:hypothetical protein
MAFSPMRKKKKRLRLNFVVGGAVFFALVVIMLVLFAMSPSAKPHASSVLARDSFGEGEIE